MSDEDLAIGVGDRSVGELDPRTISPELVMVDPELGRKARAALCSAAKLEPAQPTPPLIEDEAEAAAAATTAPSWTSIELARLRFELAVVQRELRDARHQLIEVPKQERARRRELTVARLSGALGVFFSAVLFASLLMNLGFIGYFVGGSAGRPTLAPAAPVSSVALATQQARGTERPPVVPAAELAKARAERFVLAQLLRTPRTRLPSILVDRRTGLLKNNINVVCRRSATRSNFACTVQFQHASTRVRVYLSYAGRGTPARRWVGLRP